MTINEIQDEIIEEFELFDDWMDKYEHIIEIGKETESLDEEFKTESNLVKGCQSQVWLHSRLENGKVIFQTDSDAIITKGLAGLMVKVLSGYSPEEITNSELYFINRIGLKEHLSPNRSNGFISMIKQMKLDAVALGAKHLNENG